MLLHAMAPQRKNMLEAFRSAAAQPEEPRVEPVQAEPARPAPSPPGAAGLHGAEVRRGPGALPVWIGWVVLVVVAFFAGRWVGRGAAVAAAPGTGDDGSTTAAAPGAGIVPAAPREQAPERSTPETVAPGTAGGPGQDAALLDGRNEYTVVVATYGSSMQDLAWSTVDFLRDAGLPAFTPYEVDGNIVVLAGAAPRKSELEDLVRRVRRLSRDGTEGVYDDAYIHAIDRLIRR